MIRMAVLGSPISHSLSPAIHNAAYRFLGVEAEYTSFDVEAAALESFLREKLISGWRGFSLTMPLKERVLSALSSVDSSARKIASANTVVNNDGQWHATSTDLSGFQRLFSPLACERVGVIGGGGTARAAVGALSSKVDQIDVFLRTASRIDALAAAGGGALVHARDMSDLTDAEVGSYDLLVSTLPTGAIDEAYADSIEPAGTLCEVLYHPWPTPLARLWEKNGLMVIDGIDLLVEQALEQISIFTERDFSWDELRPELLRVARREQRLRM